MRNWANTTAPREKEWPSRYGDDRYTCPATAPARIMSAVNMAFAYLGEKLWHVHRLEGKQIKVLVWAGLYIPMLPWVCCAPIAVALR